MTQSTDKLVMQVTICAVEDHDLYAVLLRIEAPRKRASRLKALSREGLRLQSGALRVVDHAADEQVPVPDKPQHLPTIQEVVNWTDE